MKNKRLSAISDSEVSSDSSKTERNSVTKTLKKNAPSDQSSNSSSDSENEIESSKISTALVTKRESLTSPKKSVPANPLEKFLAQNPNITKLSLDDYITEEHDVSVLDIPKNVSFDDFLGKVVNFNRKTKVKLNKTKYIIQPCRDDVKPINFLTNKLKIIHPVSYLKLYEYTKRKHDREELNINKFTPVLPENLKVRHPLFGAEYKNKIVLNEQVEKKLDNMIEKAMRKMERKQKQKDMEASFSKESKKERKRKQQNSKIVHGETGNDESTEIRESIFALLENHLENQKRIQSLREETPETVPNASSSQENKGRIEIEDEILSPQQKFVKNDSFNKEKKPKKKKANIEQVGTVKTEHSTPQINTELDLEKTDSSGNKRRKESSRKNDSFGREDGESDNNYSSTKQRKRQDSMKNSSEDNRKQKHHFKKEFLDSSPNESFKESLFVENGHGLDIDEVGGKKKKPNMSFKDETNSFIQPDSFEKEASHSKKQKRRSNSIKSEDFSKLTDDEGENGTRKRKHSFKKEQKDRSLDEFLAESFCYGRKNSQREDDIVKSNMVPVETDTSDMHKKKRKRQNSIKEEQFIENTDSEIDSKGKKKKLSFGSSNISEENSAIKNEKSKSKKEDKSKSGNESFKDSSFEAGYKKNNIVNSTVIPGLQLPIFEFDISRIGNKDEQRKDELLKKVEEDEVQKKKKKKKHELFNNSEGESGSNMEVQDKLVGKQDESSSSTKKHRHNENESRSSSPKKKRKRKEDTDESGFDTSALIADLLSKVKSNLKEKSRKSTDM